MFGEQALNAQRVQQMTFDESTLDEPTHRRRRWLLGLLVIGASLAAALAVAL